ncbi:MAG TPA: hypothetical protein VFW09_11950 [Solirubrobacteraceae bacterium]|jgi:hypothetical protein|nr:hypothetical protein [Solirubrobacteraceae bacterium]
MRIATFAAAALAVVLALSACGSTTKYVAGTPQAAAQAKKGLNDPRTKHIQCLRADHVTDIRKETIQGHPSFQVGTRTSGPTVVFLPTPGAAQYVQIAGEDQNAEVIGAAQVYPNQAPAKLAHEVETCTALGVSG